MDAAWTARTFLRRPESHVLQTALVALVSALCIESRNALAEIANPSAQRASTCLSWTTTPPGCPTAEQTELAVEEILGRATSANPRCKISAKGEMRPLQKGGWEANLSFVNSSGEPLGERNLQTSAANCGALMGPVSLVIALMVEANEAQATLRVPAPQPMGEVERLSVISASFVLSSGLLPSTAYGAEVGWMVELARRLSVRAASGFFFPDSTVEAARGGEFWAWFAGVGICPKLFSNSVVEASTCLASRAGVIHGVGIGLAKHEDSPTKPYGDVAVDARLAFPLLGSLAAFLQLGVAVPWVRPRFVYTDTGREAAVTAVHRPSAAVVFASLGIELRSGSGQQSGASWQ